MSMIPDNSKKDIEHRYRMGERDYDTLVQNVCVFSREAWHQGRSVDEMQVDMLTGVRCDGPTTKSVAEREWQE